MHLERWAGHPHPHPSDFIFLTFLHSAYSSRVSGLRDEQTFYAETQMATWPHSPMLAGLTLVIPEVSCALFPMMLCCCWGQVCEPPRRTQHMFSLEPTDSEDWNSGLETPAEEHLTQSYWPAEKREMWVRRTLQPWKSSHVCEGLSRSPGEGLVPRGVPLSKGPYRAGGVASTN